MRRTRSDNANSNLMKMGHLSKESGLSSSAIHHYLKLGLLQPPSKTGRTVSLYDESHLKRLKQIQGLKEGKKIPLSEIKELLKNEGGAATPINQSEENRKQQIINKAVEMFSQNGFERTKISDIADAVGLGKATFYFYFKSKEDLFMECADRLATIIVPEAAWDDIRSEVDYVNRQRKRGIAFLEAFPNFSGILNSLRIALRGNDTKLARKARDTFRMVTRPAIKDLRRAIRDGMVRELDEDLIGYLIVGAAEALGYALMMDSRYTMQEGVEAFLDFIGKGLLPSTADISRNPATGGPCWDVVDSKGNRTTIEDVAIGGRASIVGKIGEGELWVQLLDVASVTRPENVPSGTILVVMRNGEQVTLRVDGNPVLSGNSRLGRFFLPFVKVSQLTLQPENDAVRNA
jgi:AcrR family transcriptional regulator